MKISFLSLTATLAATVPYLTSAALLDFFVPESSAAASTESLPDYSKVLKKISKKRKVQTLKPFIPSLLSKNEEEEGVDIVDRDLEVGPYIPTMCEYETMINTFEGNFGNRTMELVNFLYKETMTNKTDNCFMSFDMHMCIINGTNYEYYLEDYCNSTQGTIEPYALSNYCGPLSTYTIIGLPMCLDHSCDNVTDFFDKYNESFWYDYGIWPEAKHNDECEATDISEWFNDTVIIEDAFYCDEEDEAKSEFVYKMKDGEPVVKTCDWLDQFPMELKYIQCADSSSYNISGYEYPSVADACPKACCTCKEHPEDRFFVKMKENNNGKLKAKTTECSRIDDIDDPFFKYQLCHRESQKPKLVGNGNTVCPQSCGTCPSYEMFMDDGEGE